ncbi:MAG TPA: TIGR00730 family Rossman fold protein [Rhodopila sp.]|uniref:LOG family protein n=1 Tax=Rhodopila sp. TaxID=2480087 RepID=UPI002C475CD3|nr:TIGR00730 family Rossman fold protein [Rhodopila sp.]HVY16637.1 TIGR00730 family Rossman fold protein [Rhodopila sp.]
MTQIHSLAVFCGSRVGVDPVYAAAGRTLGAGLARLGVRLVYGGGRIGIMGVVANAVLADGGTVLGVIPRFLTEMEVAHAGATEMVVTESMHVRKTRLYEESDAFLIMPGGLGTFDETFEIITWKQLGLHDKPILIANIDGWAEPLIGLIEHAIARGFADPRSRGFYEVVSSADAVIDRLQTLQPGRGGPAYRM